MQSLMTLVLVLTPLFIGFSLPKSKKLTRLAEVSLRWLVLVILMLIGIELAQIEGFLSQIGQISTQVILLSILTIGFGLIGLMVFDKLIPFVSKDGESTNEHSHPVSIRGSLLQVSYVLVGFAIGMMISKTFLPPEQTMTGLLMLLILSVGIDLKGSGITLKEVLINKRGVQTSIIFTLSVLSAGVVYSLIMPDVSVFKGLALASGFGWYSLSAVVMTESYGAVWGSVALFNDLIREFFALIFIPLIMRKFPSSAVGVGGATSLDFTLPVIQQSGGSRVVPLAISFGFIINIVAPVLMVLFSSLD